ncbi:hypothetical protein DFP73DRAFT_602686 [Morchella snyderi]|nr:hypothetical protein DFP73DRAFT_602686 [Morchella snyderi]
MGTLVHKQELKHFDHGFIRPFLRAYGLGFLSYLSPRIFSLLLSKAKRRSNKQSRALAPAVLDIFKKSLELHRFPAFCGVTIGGWHVLEPFFDKLLGHTPESSGVGRYINRYRSRIATFLASSTSAAGAIQLLNTCKKSHDAGRTLDLTFFAVSKALDVIVGELWARRKARRVSSGKFTNFEIKIGNAADAVVFAASAAAITFSWFYLPDRLPVSYNKWITDIADADSRLLETLRRIRAGVFVYGKDTGQAPLLQSMCEDLGLPKVWGDPALTKPVPCDIVHGGYSSSCEAHAIYRFWNAWKAGFLMYLGLNFLIRIRNPSIKALLRALADSAKSAAFLGTFVGSFWYAICLTRTRLGPYVLPWIDQIHLDNYCVRVGSLACGWSILIESVHRRTEVAFFMAPKALATLFPRKYSREYLWIETLIFALSSGVVYTTLKENPERVRGVFGKLLRRVVA